jgi:hypothetical protein
VPGESARAKPNAQVRFASERVYLVRHFVDELFYSPRAAEEDVICGVGPRCATTLRSLRRCAGPSCAATSPPITCAYRTGSGW